MQNYEMRIRFRAKSELSRKEKELLKRDTLVTLHSANWNLDLVCRGFHSEIKLVRA